MNQPVKIGDRIMLLHMDGETKPRLGSEGTVQSISNDPFEEDNLIISVKWDNGSSLNVLSKYDIYKIIKSSVNESHSDMKLLIKNVDIIKSYDLKFFRDYLEKVRESGVVNMFGSGVFLYSGRDYIDRYFGENQEDNEPFQEVLDMADESRNKMVSGTVKFLELKGNEITADSIERSLRINLNQILQMWMVYLH